jgi:hypothetical protein
MTDMPMVASAEDLTLSIRYADEHPDTRWYVIRRAVALGQHDRIPESWSAAGLLDGVVASVRSYASGRAPYSGTQAAVRAAFSMGDPQLNADVAEVLRGARLAGAVSLEEFEELTKP